MGPSNAKTPPETRGLREIVAAVMQDFSRAQAASDLSRAAMRQVYDRHEALRGGEPSKIRVVSAKMSIPLALSRQSAGERVDPGLSVADLRDALPTTSTDDERDEVAATLARILARRGENRLADPKLGARALAVHKELGLKPESAPDVATIKAVQKAWRRDAPSASDARFVYRAEDLAKFDPAQLVRIDIDIDVS